VVARLCRCIGLSLNAAGVFARWLRCVRVAQHRESHTASLGKNDVSVPLYSDACLSKRECIQSGHAAGHTCSRGESECGPIYCVGRSSILKQAANASSVASWSAEEPVVGTRGPSETLERAGRNVSRGPGGSVRRKNWERTRAPVISGVSPASSPRCRAIRSTQHV
jgi:hypothetical protein